MYIDHVGINTNDMEATLQFYCGILRMRLVRTTRTPDERRHYNVEIGGGNAFAGHCQINVCRAKEPQVEYAITLRQPRFSIDPPPRLGKFGASRARRDGVGG